MSTADAIPAYILAGGRSRRFGSDKARAIAQGVPLIVRIARQLEAVCSSVTVVSRNAGDYADLGLHTIADRQPGAGPLAGLDAAIADRGAGWLLMISCDFVHLNVDWIHRLINARTNAPAVAFREAHWQPMPALYHTILADRAAHHLAAGRLAMRDLLDAISATAIPMPDDWPALAHVNSPVELRDALNDDTKPRSAHGQEDRA